MQQQKTCGVCGRAIIVEHDRWTVHSNPAKAEGRFIPQCANAGQLLVYDSVWDAAPNGTR